MLEGSIAFTLSGATNSKFKALFSVWLPDYYSILHQKQLSSHNLTLIIYRWKSDDMGEPFSDTYNKDNNENEMLQQANCPLCKCEKENNYGVRLNLCKGLE